MGKIYQHQTKLRLLCGVGQDLTGASYLFKYVKPSGTTGTFGGTAFGSASDGTIYYDFGSGDINEYGNWRFWSVATFSDGRIAFGEPFTEYIYEEGT